MPFVSVGAGDCDASGVSAAPAGLFSPLLSDGKMASPIGVGDVYKRQVIRREQALSGITGRKGCVGGHVSQV